MGHSKLTLLETKSTLVAALKAAAEAEGSTTETTLFLSLCCRRPRRLLLCGLAAHKAKIPYHLS